MAIRNLLVALGGLLLALPGAVTAGDQPRELFARALGVPVSRVLESTAIELDRRVAGVFGRYERDGLEVAAVLGRAGESARILGPADDLWFAGIVDLLADTELSRQRRTPRRLSSAGLGRPVIVLFTRHQETIGPGPVKGLAASRGPGVRRDTRLFLVEPGATMRVVLRLTTEHRSEDGFGGHDVGGLELRQEEDGTYLVGMRQDRLPASRARCLEPEPYPVRFELAGDGFRELSAERPRVPCG